MKKYSSNSPIIKKERLKKKFLTITIVLSISLSFLLMLFLSKTVFFDIIYYQKSIAHGYWPENQSLVFSDFGKRSEDIVKIIEYISLQKSCQSSKILGAEDDDNTFKIAVIGDSYVWGQGLENQDRYQVLLEKKLNKIKPTKIYSLGASGDSFVDNYIKYKFIKEMVDIDLFIFGVVNNDLLFVKNNIYNQSIADELLLACPNFPTYFQPKNYQELSYLEQIESSNNQNVYNNVCVMQHVISKIDNSNSIFLFYNDFFEDTLSQSIFKNIKMSLNENNHEIVSTKEIIKVNSPFKDDFKDFYVSKKELHPSKKANYFFSDILYDYIVSETNFNY